MTFVDFVFLYFFASIVLLDDTRVQSIYFVQHLILLVCRRLCFCVHYGTYALVFRLSASLKRFQHLA